MTTDKVIVIGSYVGGVAVIRAFANKGVHVIAISNSYQDFAHLSKYVDETVRLTHPETQDEQFIECLIRNAERWKGALILESEDYWAVCLSKHKDLLKQYYKIVTPDWEILSKFIEKESTYAIAKECNIPHPKGFSPTTFDELEEVKSEIKFPCILKPIISHEFRQHFKAKNFIVNNVSELNDKFQLCIDASQPIIIQEIIPGADTNLYQLKGYINSKGDMVGRFFHKKVRQHPPMFGVMRVGVSTERLPEVERMAEKMFSYVGYKGYFSIEFKRDPRDNQLKLTENNCRLTRNGKLPLASGVNYPWLIFMDLVKDKQLDITEYTVGLYWIELYTDLYNIIFWNRSEDFRLSDYLRPYFAKYKTFAVWDVHDIKPFLKLTLTFGKAFAKRLREIETQSSHLVRL